MKWLKQDTKITGTGKDLIFVDDKYYLCHTNPSGIAYSNDLINWHDILLDDSKVKLSHLAYGNGVFLATGGAGTSKDTYVYVSFDGIEWLPKKIKSDVPFSMNSNTCKFINNRFVFITGYQYTDSQGNVTAVVIEINTTKDGKNFDKIIKKINTTKEYFVMDIDYKDGLYVMVGYDGLIMTSPDLKNWTERSIASDYDLVGISNGKGIFVITGTKGLILTSQNGIDWTRQKSNSSSYLIRSRYGNGLYIAVGYNGTVLTSINGIDWTKQEIEISSTIFGLVFANNYYVISASSNSKNKTIPIFYSEVTKRLNISTDESLYIYDKELNFVGVIDTYISLRWRRKFFEAGEFELVVAPFPNNKKYLMQKDNIIVRQNYSEAGIIDTIETMDDGFNKELKVSGKFLSYLLHRRIVKKRINYSGNIIDGMKKLITEMTPLTKKFEIEPTSLTSDNITFQCTYKNIYDYKVDLSKISNIAFRIVPNLETKVYRYENFKGLDRTRNQMINERYCFSTLSKNLSKINTVDSSVEKCNYALVGGVGEDENRIIVEVKNENVEGFDLYEKFIDAKSESNNNLSAEEYKKILKTKGVASLKEDIFSIEATAESKDYQQKWDLGDIVDLYIKDYNLTLEKRIVEIEEIKQKGTKTIHPVFGSSLPEKIELSK